MRRGFEARLLYLQTLPKIRRLYGVKRGWSVEKGSRTRRKSVTSWMVSRKRAIEHEDRVEARGWSVEKGNITRRKSATSWMVSRKGQ